MSPHVFSCMILGLALTVAACTGDDGAWPALVPAETLLADPAPAVGASPAGPLISQANILRQRADRMRGDAVIEPDIAARMQAAMD